MPRRKRLLITLGITAGLLVVAAGAAWRLLRVSALVDIGVGYSAQLTCACLFISQRPLPSCKLDLNPLARWLISIDPGPSAVTARSLGVARATAHFDQTYGCTIAP